MGGFLLTMFHLNVDFNSMSKTCTVKELGNAMHVVTGMSTSSSREDILWSSSS